MFDAWPLTYQPDQLDELEVKLPRTNKEINDFYQPSSHLTNNPEFLEILGRLNISPNVVMNVEVINDHYEDPCMIINCYGGRQFTLKSYWNGVKSVWKLVEDNFITYGGSGV